MIELKSQIIVTHNFERSLEFFKERIKPGYLHIIQRDEFKIEDAKDAIKEAYIATEKEKYIVLAAQKYNIYSQNTLLKILEEPPSNVVFIVITKAKSSLLPTIRSRLPIVSLKKEKKELFDIDIKNVDLKFVYSFLQESKKMQRDEAKEVVKALLKSSFESNLKLKEEELDQFAKALRLLELNSNVQNVLTTLFLIILEAKRR
ncbi:DNA polymerase III subunit delta' [Nitrosophilus labii]|uniref:DNA polymerase III subunit delta' n=1 Tax=Nitrosophilus labii TaxID=2706014 RepID=UPI0016574E00|nr:DNA polymerase III subunit delta' [Nitrosophilus labii]